jgi:hypothetical protein
MRPRQRVWIVALLALLTGTAIYLLGRDWSTVHLLAWAAELQGHGPALQLGSWSGSVPSFAHACGFSLLTALVLGGGPIRAGIACLFWGVTDSVLELLQRPAWSAALPPLPPGVADLPLLNNVSAYFVHGVFDVLDLVAIALGTVTAWLVARQMPAAGGQYPSIRRNSHVAEPADCSH